MAKYPIGMLEEELKNKVAADWFAAYDTTRIIGKVDFCAAIPATELALYEAEVDAKECFQSHFMSDLLSGRLGQQGQAELWEQNTSLSTPSNLRVSVPPCENLTPAARAVLDAGRELWRYYHAQPHANPNASYYDIRRHFQGTKATASGKEQMNPTSADETYNTLLSALRAAMKKLGARIEPKVYEYGFLKK